MKHWIAFSLLLISEVAVYGAPDQRVVYAAPQEPSPGPNQPNPPATQPYPDQGMDDDDDDGDDEYANQDEDVIIMEEDGDNLNPDEQH